MDDFFIHEVVFSEAAIAHHEGGHAVFSWLYGIPFKEVNIIRNGDKGGCVSVQITGLSKTKFGWSRFDTGLDMMLVAGPVAHAIFIGAPFVDDVFLSGNANALFAPGDTPGDTKGFPVLHPKVWKTYWMMKERDDIWSAITTLAHHLLDVKTVSGADASRLIRQHIPVKWPRRA